MKQGRPTAYKDTHDEFAYRMALLGMTDKEMAAVFDVTEQTFNNWKNSHESFFESLKAGKEQADAEVVKMLYKRATGYEYKEEVIEKVKDPRGGERLAKKIATKQIAPDVTAIIYWLKNRQPSKWRDKKEIEHEGRVIGGFEFADV